MTAANAWLGVICDEDVAAARIAELEADLPYAAILDKALEYTTRIAELEATVAAVDQHYRGQQQISFDLNEGLIKAAARVAELEEALLTAENTLDYVIESYDDDTNLDLMTLKNAAAAVHDALSDKARMA